MKKIRFILLLGIIMLIPFSCEKDKDKSDTIYGKWAVLSGGGNTKYIIIGSDNVFYWLEEYNYGFRGEWSGVCQITGGQINFGIMGLMNFSIMNFSISNNQLTLSHPSMASIICERDNNAPEREDWIKTILSVHSSGAPIDEATDLTYDGQYLWYGNGYASHNLYKINPSNITVEATIPVSQSAWAVEWVDGYLWVSSNGSDKIYKINPANGNLITQSVEMGAWIEGIAFDGQYIWCASNNESTLYKYDRNTNSVVSDFFVDMRVHGLCYNDGFLYACAEGIVNKCSLNPLEVVEAFALENYNIEGIAYDGVNFWVSTANYNETPSYRIQKVTF